MISKKQNIVIIIVSIIISLGFMYLLSDGDSRLFYLTDDSVRIEEFGKTPEFSMEVYSFLDRLPLSKRETIYRTKVVIYGGSYSPSEHLRKHPADVAVLLEGNSADPLVVILTNEEVTKDLFIQG